MTTNTNVTFFCLFKLKYVRVCEGGERERERKERNKERSLSFLGKVIGAIVFPILKKPKPGASGRYCLFQYVSISWKSQLI